MKKITITVAILLAATLFTSAQVLPTFQFGVKGGVNLSKFSTSGTFDSGNRAGYLAGVWARIGALGFNLQPELYYTSKIATISNSSTENTVTINSIDLPVLVGYKFGAFGLGGRLNTGPVASFILSKDQSFSNAVGNALTLDLKNQAFAWQFGAGIDIMKLSVDLRYELGLTNLNNTGYDQKLNLFNLSLAYKLF
ncbi:porin family protein [Mucilaginibacter sp. AW1-3]